MHKEIIQLLVDIEPSYDKMSHLYYGTILSLLLILIRNNFGIIPILIISCFKEIFDYFTQGSVELLDIYYSILPSVLFSLILLIKKIKNE